MLKNNSEQQQEDVHSEAELYSNAGLFKRRDFQETAAHTNDRIRKEVHLSPAAIMEFGRITLESEFCQEDDRNWAEPDSLSRLELEIVQAGYHMLSHFFCDSQDYVVKPCGNS